MLQLSAPTVDLQAYGGFHCGSRYGKDHGILGPYLQVCSCEPS